jgi:hypothetical protein
VNSKVRDKRANKKAGLQLACERITDGKKSEKIASGFSGFKSMPPAAGSTRFFFNFFKIYCNFWHERSAPRRRQLAATACRHLFLHHRPSLRCARVYFEADNLEQREKI